MERAVFSWPDKFIAFSNGRRELYDLAHDPEENRNLVAAEAPAARQLGAELHAWVKTMPLHTNPQANLDVEGIRRLKSLGYVQ
jgi:hypothetical protein